MLVVIAAVVAAFGGSDYRPVGPKIEITLQNHKNFVISTDAKGSPKTTAGILKLVRSGFYNGLSIHRVEDWVIQWGDPQSKTLPAGDRRLGFSGSGHPLPFENSKASFVRGVVGIASTGAGVGGDGQLFVLTKDMPELDHKYAILGKVTSGMENVDKVKLGERILSMTVVGTQRKR